MSKLDCSKSDVKTANGDDILFCEDCEIQKDTVFHTTCPYADDVYGFQITIVMCPACSRQRGMDI